jgi:hypothetical protein
MGTNSIFSYKCFVLKLHQTVLSGWLKHLGINSKFTKFKLNKKNQTELFSNKSNKQNRIQNNRKGKKKKK